MKDAVNTDAVSTDALRREIASRRKELEELEARLRREERREHDAIWFPQGFYTAYYVLSGLVLGMVASWTVVVLNIVGASVVGEDPLKLLRVYSTILGGERSPEEGTKAAVILMFALGMHTLTGAICGAPIHVVYSRFFAGQTLVKRIATGVVLGIVMWLVNFYGILYWLQPMILGTETSYIVDSTPAWVAALSHIAFTVIVVLLQPLALFNAKNYPETAPNSKSPNSASPDSASPNSSASTAG